jgi:hypothetical protein
LYNSKVLAARLAFTCQNASEDWLCSILRLNFGISPFFLSYLITCAYAATNLAGLKSDYITWIYVRIHALEDTSMALSPNYIQLIKLDIEKWVSATCDFEIAVLPIYLVRDCSSIFTTEI